MPAGGEGDQPIPVLDGGVNVIGDSYPVITALDGADEFIEIGFIFEVVFNVVRITVAGTGGLEYGNDLIELMLIKGIKINVFMI